MKRSIAILTLFGLLGAGLSGATDDPHGSGSSIGCPQCHVTHSTLGELLIDAADPLISTLCLSCHTPGGWPNMDMELSSSQKAVPGSSGTSHSWDVPAENSTYDTQAPSQQTLLDHLASDGSITCSTCHDPHENSEPPFLRLDNSANALCLDCHAVREVASVKTYNGNELSHPIGLPLPSGDGYHNPPLDVDGNPQPSDGNSTNDFDLGAGDTVLCTTCHGVHDSDSDSGTVDGS